MTTAWGSRRLDELLASDIETMKRTATSSARSRRSSRHGRHAGEHVVAAARAIYNLAIASLIDQKFSPRQGRHGWSMGGVCRLSVAARFRAVVEMGVAVTPHAVQR